MTTDQLEKLICSELVVGLRARHERRFLVTSFSYPDGDSINAYLERPQRESYLSDRGITRFKALDRNVDFTDKNQHDRVRSICAFHRAEWDGIQVRRRIATKSAPADFLAFCQAVARVADVAWYPDHHRLREFSEVVDHFVSKKIEPQRPALRNWTLSSADPHHVYSVDYHFNSSGPPVHVFTVGSKSKAILTSAVANFLRAHSAHYPTMSIIDSAAGLGDRHVRRLQLACDELVFGLQGNERLVTDFVLAGSPLRTEN